MLQYQRAKFANGDQQIKSENTKKKHKGQLKIKEK
jgi:hypothetical protein